MSQINKRELLRKAGSLTLGGIIAGCLSSDQTSQQNRETRDKTNNYSNASKNQSAPSKQDHFSNFDRRFIVEDMENEQGLKAELEAEIVQQLSEEHPPKLKITFTCTAEEPQRYGLHYIYTPFSTRIIHSKVGSNKLGYDTESRYSESYEDCWVYDVPGGGVDADGSMILKPGEKRSITRAIFSHPNNKECYPADEYIFEDEYYRLPLSEYRKNKGNGSWYTGKFKLLIKNDGS